MCVEYVVCYRTIEEARDGYPCHHKVMSREDAFAFQKQHQDAMDMIVEIKVRENHAT
jgi:hypothetical protein